MMDRPDQTNKVDARAFDQSADPRSEDSIRRLHLALKRVHEVEARLDKARQLDPESLRTPFTI